MTEKLINYLDKNIVNNDSYFLELSPIENFDQFLVIAGIFNDDNLNKKTGWIFRGDGDYKRDLESELERQIKRWKIPNLESDKIEKSLIYQFKRRYQAYSYYKPDDDRVFEWLTIMQHYSCPTRLIDFSYRILKLCFSLFLIVIIKTIKTRNVKKIIVL